MPKISVIIPLYNHQDYIGQTISSVLSQTVEDFELIIIDDGSSDGSANIVKTFSDNRIQYHYQENRGAHSAINYGIRLSSGKYVSILNSDDLYMSERLNKCQNISDENDSVDAVFSGIHYVDDKGNIIKTTLGPEENWKSFTAEPSFASEDSLILHLLAGNFLKTTSNLFFRRSVIESVGLFRNLRYAHDYDFFLRLIYKSNVKLLNEPLLKYRCHDKNTIKESSSNADIECALVLADFLTNYDLSSVFNLNDPVILSKLFNSINTHNADRFMFILVLFHTISNKSKGSLLDMVIDNPENLIWSTTKHYMDNFHDGWQAREKILNDWNHLHSLYQKLEKEHQLISGSISYRIERKLKTMFNFKN